MMCDDVSCQFRTRNTFVVLDDSTPSCPGCLKGRLKDEVGHIMCEATYCIISVA